MSQVTKAFPAYVADILATKFTPEQISVIDANFDWYSNGFRFGSATKRGIIAEGRKILDCANSIKNYPCGPGNWDFINKCPKN